MKNCALHAESTSHSESHQKGKQQLTKQFNSMTMVSKVICQCLHIWVHQRMNSFNQTRTLQQHLLWWLELTIDKCSKLNIWAILISEDMDIEVSHNYRQYNCSKSHYLCVLFKIILYKLYFLDLEIHFVFRQCWKTTDFVKIGIYPIYTNILAKTHQRSHSEFFWGCSRHLSVKVWFFSDF